MIPAPRPRARAVDAALVVLLAVAGHAAALHDTQFTIDDHEIVEENPRLAVAGPGDAWTLVTTSYWGDAYAVERLWRPVVLASFALDRALFGPDPDAYHAVNVGLHAATSVLVLVLAARLLRGRRAALAAALLFAGHPAHAEATAGVVGRAEVLALLFALAGTLAHLRARERGGGAAAFALPAGLFLLGFGSKEGALTAPFVLALLELVAGAPLPEGPGRRRAIAAPYALYALAIGAYFAARVAVLGAVAPPPEAQSLGGVGLPVRVLVAAWAARKALQALLAPAPAAAIFPPFDRLPAWSDPEAVLPVLVHVAVLGLAVAALRRRDLRALGLGVLGFYLTLGPSSNIVPIGVVFADRLLYTPSAWLAIAAAAAAARVLDGLAPRARRLAWTVALVAALAPCAVLLSRNAHAWSHEVAIWVSTVRRFEGAPMAHYGLGRALLLEGRPADARPHLEVAITGPSTARYAAPARAALAQVLHAGGESERALALLEEARRLDPGDALALKTLARVPFDLALATRDEEKRAEWLARAERAAAQATYAAPHRYDLWLDRAQVLERLPGREAEAEAAYDQAVTRRPDPWEALVNRGLLRARRGAREDALADLRRAAEVLLERRGRATPHEARFLRIVMAERAGLGDAEARAWLAANP